MGCQGCQWCWLDKVVNDYGGSDDATNSGRDNNEEDDNEGDFNDPPGSIEGAGEASYLGQKQSPTVLIFGMPSKVLKTVPNSAVKRPI